MIAKHESRQTKTQAWYVYFIFIFLMLQKIFAFESNLILKKMQVESFGHSRTGKQH
jgi:hypothetical protein